jgi:D-glycero-D-manno-heptose 1,7-bisphosphate phosphatase
MEFQNTSHPGSFDDDDGIWRRILTEPAIEASRPALFLDRDGVLVEEVNYLSRVEDVVMIPRASETIATANRHGVPVVIVTNQAGIAHGYYGWPEFEQVQEFIMKRLAEGGASIDAIYACAYHPSGIRPYAHPDHPARKPRPGMLLAAARELAIDLTRSWIVGDKVSDLEAGRTAGLTGGVHVLTGHGRNHRHGALALETPEFTLLPGNSIADASQIIWRLRS